MIVRGNFEQEDGMWWNGLLNCEKCGRKPYGEITKKYIGADVHYGFMFCAHILMEEWNVGESFAGRATLSYKASY